jgi:uncharacterized protein YdiU (UPF0061 family)
VLTRVAASHIRVGTFLEHSYDDQPDYSEFEQPPAPGERVLRTFCGT